MRTGRPAAQSPPFGLVCAAGSGRHANRHSMSEADKRQQRPSAGGRRRLSSVTTHTCIKHQAEKWLCRRRWGQTLFSMLFPSVPPLSMSLPSVPLQSVPPTSVHRVSPSVAACTASPNLPKLKAKVLKTRKFTRGTVGRFPGWSAFYGAGLTV